MQNAELNEGQAFSNPKTTSPPAPLQQMTGLRFPAALCGPAPRGDVTGGGGSVLRLRPRPPPCHRPPPGLWPRAAAAVVPLPLRPGPSPLPKAPALPSLARGAPRLTAPVATAAPRAAPLGPALLPLCCPAQRSPASARQPAPGRAETFLPSLVSADALARARPPPSSRLRGLGPAGRGAGTCERASGCGRWLIVCARALSSASAGRKLAGLRGPLSARPPARAPSPFPAAALHRTARVCSWMVPSFTSCVRRSLVAPESCREPRRFRL